MISGINDGANMGDDTIYSGTVAAAMEGYLLGIPSFAVSMSRHNPQYFSTAARVVEDLIRHYEKTGFPPPLLLNVNVPDIPYEELHGMAVTRLGKRHKAEPVIKSATPRGETVYWVGAAGGAQDSGPGTDFYAVQNQQVSLTPLQIDLTQYKQLDALQNWLGLKTETKSPAEG